jgi:hypothetical protein
MNLIFCKMWGCMLNTKSNYIPNYNFLFLKHLRNFHLFTTNFHLLCVDSMCKVGVKGGTSPSSCVVIGSCIAPSICLFALYFMMGKVQKWGTFSKLQGQIHWITLSWVHCFENSPILGLTQHKRRSVQSPMPNCFGK